MKFDIWELFDSLLRRFKFDYNPTIITCTLHEDMPYVHLWK